MLGRLAILGVVLALAYAAYESFPVLPRQAYGLFVLAGTLVLAPLAVRLLMPEAWRMLRRRPALLVPLGLRSGVVAALTLALLGLPWADLMGRETSARFLGLTWTISAWGAVMVLVAVVYAAWATILIVRTARGEDCDARAALRETPRRFLRTFGLLAFGMLAIVLPTAALLALHRGSGTAIEYLLVPLALWAAFTNLATAALLPVGLTSVAGFPGALREGLTAGFRGMRRWWPAVLAQMFLLGWVMYLGLTWREDTVVVERDGGSTVHRTTHSTHRTSQWKVHATWTGGYADDSEWHDLMLELVEQPRPSPLIVAALVLLLSVLAVAVKYTIAARLWENESPSSYSSVFQ